MCQCVSMRPGSTIMSSPAMTCASGALMSSAYRDDFAVTYVHEPARNVSKRIVHGHHMRVAKDKLTPRPDVGGRPGRGFRILCALGEDR